MAVTEKKNLSEEWSTAKKSKRRAARKQRNLSDENRYRSTAKRGVKSKRPDRPARQKIKATGKIQRIKKSKRSRKRIAPQRTISIKFVRKTDKSIQACEAHETGKRSNATTRRSKLKMDPKASFPQLGYLFPLLRNFSLVSLGAAEPLTRGPTAKIRGL